MTTEPQTPSDDELLAELARGQRTTSQRHDDAVLAAARNVADQRRRSARGGGLSWWRALFVAVPVLAVGVFVAGRLAETPGVDQPDGEQMVVRGFAIDVTPADGAELSAAPPLLAWAEVAGAHEYRVQLMDAAALVIFSSDWQDAAELSLADAPALTPGRYIWTVEVRNGQSSELGPYTFTVQ